MLKNTFFNLNSVGPVRSTVLYIVSFILYSRIFFSLKQIIFLLYAHNFKENNNL